MLNPLVLLALVLAFIGVGGGGFASGHHFGVATQKVADQVQFDTINEQLTQQKAEANAAYRAFQEHNVALAEKADDSKTQLEKRREENRTKTIDVRDRYADVGLRFQPAEDAGYRIGGGGSAKAEAVADSPSGAQAVQLPGSLAARLRRIVFDADDLNDDYKKCYDAINNPNLCPK